MSRRRGLRDPALLALALVAGAGALGSGLFGLLAGGPTSPTAYFDTALGLAVLLIAWAWVAPALIPQRAPPVSTGPRPPSQRPTTESAPSPSVSPVSPSTPPVASPSLAPGVSAVERPFQGVGPTRRSPDLLVGSDLVRTASAPSWPRARGPERSTAALATGGAPDEPPARPRPSEDLEFDPGAPADAKPEEMIEELDRLVDDLSESPKRRAPDAAPDA